MKLTESTNDQIMAIAAFRYGLSRQTYVVGACLEWLRATWGDFTRQTRLIIVRDTVEALMDGTAGSPTIDAPGWRAFAEWAWGQLGDEDRTWVLRATAHKPEAWPLGKGEKEGEGARE